MKAPLFYIVLFIIHIAHPSSAQQNLILNGGFEEHSNQKCLECNTLYGQYPSLVYHWDNGNWGCWLCDKNYRQNSEEKKWKGCPFDKIPPQQGKSMIEMRYLPRNNGIYGGIEGSHYLSAHTTQPLHVGHLYEVSFWIHIASSLRADPEWARHIGIALLPQNIKVHGLRGKKLVMPFLSIDTVMNDKWYQVKWRVRPLCTSNYLMIGVFADDHWPISRSYSDVCYYIDNVELFEIPSKSAISDSSIYYCSRYEPKALGVPPKMDNEILLFQNNTFDLISEHKLTLDSFVVFARKYPDLVFELSGHTDSIGTDNFALSQKRVQSVHRYLTVEHQLPEFRFITLSLADKNALRPNNLVEGRKMNRRVEIRQSQIDLPMVFYRKALKAVEEKRFADAFSYLNKWMAKSNQGMKIIMLFDPRFVILKKDKRWESLEKKIRDGYNCFKYPEYSFQLDSLRLDDLMVLGEISMVLNNLSGHIPEIDSVEFYLPRMSKEEVDKKFREHFVVFNRILQRVGWPKRSEFGESASNSAIILLQHSLDSSAYVRWLPVLQKTCEDGEAPWMAYAMLYDRCQIIAGKLQRYATHSETLENGNLRVLPWEGDENTVNDYRAKLGLPLLSRQIVDSMENNEK